MKSRTHTVYPKSPIEKERQKKWSKFSKELLAPRETVCEICGVHKWMFQPRKKVWKSNRIFQIHHRHYNTVGHETREDVQILCFSCHQYSHWVLRLSSEAPWILRLKALVKEVFQYEPGAYRESRRKLKEDE